LDINIDYIDHCMTIESSPENQNPAVTQTALWIGSQIRSGVWAPGDNLPTIEKLAVQANVSHRCVRSALASLASEGVIILRQGRPARVSGGGKEKQATWKHIANQLANAILAGEFLPGAILPPIAKLQLRFNACYRTMYRALSNLEHERTITRSGGRYVIPTIGSSRANLEVLLFNESGAFGSNIGLSEMIQLSERHSKKLGVQLNRYEHSYSIPFNTVDLNRILKQDTIAGYVIDFWGTGTPEREKNFLDLLSILLNTGKPLAIVDQVGDLTLPEPYYSSRQVLGISVAGRIAGEDIGQYLISSAHRHIAFIAPAFDQTWSNRRCTGLKRAFSHAGLDTSLIKEFRAMPAVGVAPLVCVAAGVSRQDMERLFAPNISAADLDQLQNQRVPLAKQLHLQKSEVFRIKSIIKVAKTMPLLGDKDSIADRMQLSIVDLLGAPYHTRLHAPIFQTIFDDPSITAWVAATDGIGIPALQFLNTKANQSRKISIVGFDNSLASTADGLSSYDFDLAGRLHHAFSFALGRIAGNNTKTHRIIEWPGILYQRKSSGKARN
jgi:DNA-binding FadR family transcriptional regulator/DNA-binding LacI/PurR family transcriptional regulator